MPAISAYRKLGFFKDEAKRCEEWCSDEDDFAEKLADFYATLLEPSYISSEDLVGGFKEYNFELLAWFQM